MQSRILRRAACLAVLALCGLLTAPAEAGKVVLQYGFEIRGMPVKISHLTARLAASSRQQVEVTPIWLVDDGMRRVFVPSRLVPDENVNRDADQGSYESFAIRQERQPKRRQVNQLGAFRVVEPLNEFGRRTIEIKTSNGVVPVVQGITEINPYHVKFAAMSDFEWEFAMSTNAIPYATLDPVLRRVVDENDPVERMAVARLYLQAGLFTESIAELQAIREKFPDRDQEISKFLNEMLGQRASLLMQDLGERRTAGQRTFALVMSQQLPTTLSKEFPGLTMPPDVLQQVRTIVDEETEAGTRISEMKLLLGDLQAKLSTKDLQREVNLPRMEIVATLDRESLPKLQPFMNLLVDETLSADEKLGLAVSGWLLGPENADTDLPRALQLWEVRRLILEYLRNRDPLQDEPLLKKIVDSEGVGPTTVIPLLRHLPPIVETPGVTTGFGPGQLLELQTDEPGGDTPVDYAVSLPIEYSPHHEYPLILELRPREHSAAKMVTWWADQAQRRGYIVIAPEFLEADATEYDYSVASHEKIQRTLTDALKRFRIDTEKIFVAGHGTGADAAFDFGMAHPDQFAGVIAISGLCRHHCTTNWKNDKTLSLYVVSGEKDRGLLEQNSAVLDRMVRYGRDVIYVEYMGRGYETYYEEIHRLMDWMALHRRTDKVTDIEADVIRPTDTRLYWLEAVDLPPAVYQNDPITPGGRVRRINIEGTIKYGLNNTQTVSVRVSPGRAVLWLMPDVIDFEKPLTIRAGGSLHQSGEIPNPDVKVMLEDFRNRGDRKHIAWGKILLD